MQMKHQNVHLANSENLNGNPKQIMHNNFVIKCSDLLPIAKNPQLLLQLKAKDDFGQFPSLFVYNCVDLNSRKWITNVCIDLNNGLLGKPSFQHKLYKLDCFPNLKRVRIISDYRTPIKIMEMLYDSLPNCSKLEKVNLCNDWYEDVEKVKLLNRLASQDWKCFGVSVVDNYWKVTSYPNDFEIHLPNVNNLYIFRLFFLRHIKTFPKALQSFSCEPSMVVGAFPVKEFNLITANVTEMYLGFNSLRGDNGDTRVFSQKLPNLKTLDIEVMKGCPIFLMDDIYKTFKEVSKRVLFGDFDMRNPDHSLPLVVDLINQLPKEVTLESIDPRLAGPSNSFEDNFKRFLQTASIVDIYGTYYRLKTSIALHVHHDRYMKYRMQNIEALLYLDILENIPNLEYLTINSMLCIEQHFSFHRLMKHHKKLKTVLLDELQYSRRFVPSKTDEFYNRFYESMLPYPIHRRDGVRVRNPNPKFDLESLRKKIDKTADHEYLLTCSKYKGNFEFERKDYTIKYTTRK